MLEALIRLPATILLLRTRGLVAAQAYVRPARSHSESVPVEKVVGAVEAAANVWRANCLQRSMTLWWMLRRRGQAADLRIGVRSEPERPAFHAWVEQSGVVLNDSPDVAERFAPFSPGVLPPGARFV